MTRLQTIVGSLNLSDGERQPRALNLRAVEPVDASPQAVAKGSLYVLLGITGARPVTARLYRLLLNTIQGVYYDAPGGIRGGITEAILAAHRALAQHNAVHPEDRFIAGASCVVLRGEELFLGVGGPAMVVVGHPGRVEQFPGELSPIISPLGGREGPAIEIFRTSVTEEAMVVQLQEAWVDRVPSRKLAASVLFEDAEGALEYLEAVAPTDGDFGALVLQITALEESVEEAAAVLAEEPDDFLPFADDDFLEVDDDEDDGWEAEDDLAEPEPVAEEERSGRRWPWLLALLIPLLVIALVVGVRWWQQNALNQEVQALIEGAQAALSAAGQEGTPENAARAQLSEAETRIARALELRPNDADALALRPQVQDALNAVNRVTPLYGLLTVRELGGAGSEPARLEVQGGRVYVLDRGSDTVTRYNFDQITGTMLDSSSLVVAQRGQALADGQLVGEALDMTWASAGGERLGSGLLVVDSNRHLLEPDEVLGLGSLAVAARETWQEPRAIASYIGNFYLADSGSGKLWRYRPSADGYGNAPEEYLESDAVLDLSLVVDMAIDGNIWLLYRDGTLQSFYQGRQVAFELEPPPDRPIAEPVAMWVGADAGDAQPMYIADAGEGRILEYDKGGRYVRQFRPVDAAEQAKLRSLRDLQVDEVEGVFYILTAEGLLRSDIP